MNVTPKKALGQHFLKDLKIASRIVESLSMDGVCDAGKRWNTLEVGPGMGVLTQFLINRSDLDIKVAEIDRESVVYLERNFPELKGRIIEGDFLKMELDGIFDGEFLVIGNFPYNISSQIFFRVLEYRERIPMVVGMLQKEVAERLASPPGNKDYGILSVLLQAWYDIEYLFSVDEHVFNPPPKVKSAVIRLKRNGRTSLGCDEDMFKKVVKTSFNQRRKTIRNSVKSLFPSTPGFSAESPLFAKRPEQLSVDEFVELTIILTCSKK